MSLPRCRRVVQEGAVEEPDDAALVLLGVLLDGLDVRCVGDRPDARPTGRSGAGTSGSAPPVRRLFGAQMSSTGRGAIAGARSTRLGGGASLENSSSAGVLGQERVEAPDHRRRRRTARAPRSGCGCPAPSETTAARSGLSAAAWSSISPETDRPSPPIRAGSTSGRPSRKSTAAWMSRAAAPAEEVRVALAGALPAPVEEQDAVPVLDEHPGVRLRLGAAGEDRPRRRSARARTSRGSRGRRSW